MIEIERDADGKMHPVIVCDICFERITDVLQAYAMWNASSLRTVFHVHYQKCRPLAYRLWGAAGDLCSVGLRVHLLQLLRSVGYLGLAVTYIMAA